MGGYYTFCLAVLLMGLSGCGREKITPGSDPASAKTAETSIGAREDQTAPTPPPRSDWTAENLHAALQAANADYQQNGQFHIEGGQVRSVTLAEAQVADLSSLKGMPLVSLDLRAAPVRDIGSVAGMPLVELYLDDTRVSDLSPLQGMKLRKLYLNSTPIDSIEVLRGMPLEELNLLGTGVRDLSPLRGMPLRMLWLNETPVSDITPIAGCPLESLTLHRTEVRDLSSLAHSSLLRLHIGETPVHDLTLISRLRLTRLIFTPKRIKSGIHLVRKMDTLRELGTTFENRMAPSRFWQLYDQGHLEDSSTRIDAESSSP